MNNNIQVSFDYLTFTDKVITEPETICSKYLGMDYDLFSELPYGLLGYKKAVYFNGIYILFDGDNSSDTTPNTMTGCCVSMSGDGCRTFDEFNKLQNHWYDLCRNIINNECNVTRCDIACDDFYEYLDIENIIELTKNGQVRSRLKKRQIVQDFDGKNHSGATVYFGSPSSDTRIRIYDKAREQELVESDHWIRCEVVLRHEQAKAFIELACEYDIGKLIALVLNDKLTFINFDDSNISRCSVCEFWSKFVNTLESVHLITSVKVVPTIERSAEWFKNQVAPSFSVLWDTLGMDLILDCLDYGRNRLSKEQSALVNEYHRYRKACKNKAMAG